jgi:hypothetical protein
MIVVISGVHSLFLFFLHLRLGQSCSAVLTIILENSVIILSMFWGLSSFVCTIWAIKTAEQLCPKRKCKKKRKREWTPDMTTIMKKGKFYHWKWKQEGNRDNRESANYKKYERTKDKTSLCPT